MKIPNLIGDAIIMVAIISVAVAAVVKIWRHGPAEARVLPFLSISSSSCLLISFLNSFNPGSALPLSLGLR